MASINIKVNKHKLKLIDLGKSSFGINMYLIDSTNVNPVFKC